MRAYLIILLLFFLNVAKSQTVDSAWLAKNFIPRLSTGNGIKLPESKFIDEKGKIRTLADFKGKILYIDVWATNCAPCIGEFPDSEQLFNRLKAISLDSSVQFINICTGETKKRWKKLLKQHNPTGINLFSIDTLLEDKWKVDAVPHYLLLDKDGTVLAKDFIRPSDAFTEYALYAATKGIKPAESIWVAFRENQFYLNNRRFTSDAEGVDYSKWYNATIALQVAYSKWRTSRLQKSKSSK